MAEVCVALRMAPSEYWNLTTDEEAALIKAFAEQQKKQKGR